MSLDPQAGDYDAVHPDGGTLEALRVMEAFAPDNPHRFTAIKYVLRAGRKPGADVRRDIDKAIFYLRRELELLDAATGLTGGEG